MNSNQKLVILLRELRIVHKYIGVALAFFMLVIASTGVLLGWKKNVEALQPRTFEGASSNLSDWKSFDSIAQAALSAMDSVLDEPLIDRMDVRPDKGIVKVLFTQGYWEAQVDGASGKVLSVSKRHSDWIEHVHDGSIVSDGFKLVYTNLSGFSLVTLALSGLLLWYGPRIIRKGKGNVV